VRIGVASLIELEPLARHLDDWDGLSGEWSFPYITTLVEGLLARGHEIHVFALNGQISAPRQYSGQSLTVDVLPMRTSGASRVADIYSMERHVLTEAMKISQCEVIHAHWTYEFGAAAVSSGIPNVVTAHHSPWAAVADARLLKPQLHGIDRYSDALKNLSREFVRASLSEWVVNRADVVTAVSPNVQSHLKRLMFPRSPVELIPNGLQSEVDQYRASVKDPEAPIFAFIGNGFGARKNSATALKAFARVRQEIPEAKLLLIGVEHESGGIGHLWAQGENLATNCLWLGPISNEEVRALMRNEIDILVHTSRWEACSIAIMEAQSFGIPVIGGKNSGGVSYSLQDGRAGLIADITKPEVVSNAMIQLAAQHSEYARISSGGLEAINSVFNINLILDAYESAYLRARDKGERD
jgi:glycosyltransferase involved in cell wall biosynthesis